VSQYLAIHNAIIDRLESVETSVIYYDENTKKAEETNEFLTFDIEAVGPTQSEFSPSDEGRNFSSERTSFSWLARGAFKRPVDFVGWEEELADLGLVVPDQETFPGAKPFVLEISTVEYSEPPRSEDTAVQISVTFNIRTMRRR